MTKRYGQLHGKAGAPRIVDDDPMLVDRLVQVLEDDYEVFATDDWSELSRLYFRERCDLLLVDVNLPGLGGEKIVQILRNQRVLQGRPAPILFLSSADEDQLARHVRETGADGALSKSLKSAELLREIRRHLPSPA